jgi:hypothetical protein
VLAPDLVLNPGRSCRHQISISSNFSGRCGRLFAARIILSLTKLSAQLNFAPQTVDGLRVLYLRGDCSRVCVFINNGCRRHAGLKSYRQGEMRSFAARMTCLQLPVTFNSHEYYAKDAGQQIVPQRLKSLSCFRMGRMLGF